MYKVYHNKSNSVISNILTKFKSVHVEIAGSIT